MDLCSTCQARYSTAKGPNAGKKCPACMGIFAYLEGACRSAASQARQAGMEFSSFSVSSTVPAGCDAFDFAMLRRLGYMKATPIKNAINREAAEIARRITGKKTGGFAPEAILKLDFRKGSYSFVKKSVFVFGRYEKIEAGLSQTKWLCSWCNGKGCRHCGMRGTRFEDSVHQQIEKGFEHAGSAGSKLHGSGREDVDVRTIGYGRPFVIELASPLKREIDLEKAWRIVNSNGKVRIHGLALVNAGMVEVLKNSRFDKNYHASVELEKPAGRQDALKAETLTGARIIQHTPTRVLKRRSDRPRAKSIFRVSARIENGRIESDVFAECGTYIKELVSSDNGRTKPSYASVIGRQAHCSELVMTGVQDNYIYSILAPRKWKYAKPA